MELLKIFSMLLLITGVAVAYPLEEVPTVVPILTPPDAGEDAKSPVESEPQNPPPPPSNSATEFPILLPSDEDFEIYRPMPADEDPAPDNNTQINYPDVVIERPYPLVQKLGLESSVLGNERFRRSPVPSGTDEDDDTIVIDSAGKSEDDDTVTVNAATCGELLADCTDKDDLLSCQAYNENCTNNEGDDSELGDFINCANRIASDNKDGSTINCPPIPTSN